LQYSVAGHYRSEPTKALIHNASKHCITLTTDTIRRMLVQDGSKIKITVSPLYIYVTGKVYNLGILYIVQTVYKMPFVYWAI
jgi:hypothetical protein